jgi:hypothetical protein
MGMVTSGRGKKSDAAPVAASPNQTTRDGISVLLLVAVPQFNLCLLFPIVARIRDSFIESPVYPHPISCPKRGSVPIHRHTVCQSTHFFVNWS